MIRVSGCYPSLMTGSHLECLEITSFRVAIVFYLEIATFVVIAGIVMDSFGVLVLKNSKALQSCSIARSILKASRTTDAAIAVATWEVMKHWVVIATCSISH